MIAGILIVIVIIVGLVVVAACMRSSQISNMVDRTGKPIYPDHCDRIGEARP